MKDNIHRDWIENKNHNREGCGWNGICKRGYL